MMKPVSAAIELGEGPRYGYLHVAGCGDLRDPEPIGAIFNLEDVGVIVSEVTGWDCDDEYFAVAACLRDALKKAAG